MASPCQQHRERVLAARTPAAVELLDRKAATQYELMLMQLATDRRRLKQIQSIERKIALKRELLPAYAAYVEGVITSQSGRPDDVLMTILVWRIDTGDLSGAIELAAYALQYGLNTPDRYERTTACLIAEEMADTALRGLTAGQTVDPDLLEQTWQLTAPHDMFDPVRARLLKAIGLAQQQAGQPHLAVEPLKRALELDDRCGVKKIIEQLERELKKEALPASQEQPEAGVTTPAGLPGEPRTRAAQGEADATARSQSPDHRPSTGRKDPCA